MKRRSLHRTVLSVFPFLFLFTIYCEILNGQDNTESIAGARSGSLAFTGTSLSGGEFYGPKPGKTPVYGKNFIYPTSGEFDYFAGKGMNIFRIPFRWETLQPEMNQPFNQTETDRLRACVTAATSKGLTVILDPHNYARYYDKVVGSADMPDAAFADFWGKLASVFKDDPHVWFGLMNEPHGLPTEQWLGAANAAIDAIRKTGAKNRILVRGNGWTSAGQWLKNGNDIMIGIKDPAANFIFEVHTYFDSDNSGTHPTVASPTVGRERLHQFALWCREHKVKAFLGEFGAPASPDGEAVVKDTLAALEEDRDVWVGFTWWSAGPWWGNYMFSIEPKREPDGSISDSQQINYLLTHLKKVEK